MPMTHLSSVIVTLLPCVLPPAPLTEVKMNVMKWIRGIAIVTQRMVNAMSALQFQLLLFLELTDGNATIMVAPGMRTADASNFSCGNLSHIVI
jgi:hypothetical protein